MIKLTLPAVNKIKQQLARRGKGVGICVGVKTTGCSGMAYVLEYVDALEYTPGVTDFTQNDVIIRVDHKHLVYLDGLEIDYVRQGLNEGFEFSNPNERDRCGCGESFRV